MKDADASRGSNTFLATEPATLGLRRCALTIVIVLFVLFCALIPVARIPLPRFEASIPISEAALAARWAAHDQFFARRVSQIPITRRSLPGERVSLHLPYGGPAHAKFC